MTYNDILRRTRYALNIADPVMIEIFGLAGHVIEQSLLTSLLTKEGEPGYVVAAAESWDISLTG